MPSAGPARAPTPSSVRAYPPARGTPMMPRRSQAGTRALVAAPACLAALCAVGRGFVSAPAAAEARAPRLAPHAAPGAAAPTPEAEWAPAAARAALAAGAAGAFVLAAGRPGRAGCR